MIPVVHPGSLFFAHRPDPGVKKTTGSRIRNTLLKTLFSQENKGIKRKAEGGSPPPAKQAALSASGRREAGASQAPKRPSKVYATYLSKPVFQIRIHMFLGLPDPDLLVRGMDPDPSIIKQK
jgi:hypothetical protein